RIPPWEERVIGLNDASVRELPNENPDDVGFSKTSDRRFALADRFFRPLTVSQIEHEANAFCLAFVEGRGGEQNRHTTTVFAEVLLLDRRAEPGRLVLAHPLFLTLAPVRRRQISPSEYARRKIVAGIPNNSQKCVVG